MNTRYILVRDNDGHSYIIPNEKKNQFYKWISSDTDHDCPSWAYMLGGSASDVEFTDPTIKGLSAHFVNDVLDFI